MQTWWEIVTDPHHIFADFIMNVGFEIFFAWITFLLMLRIFIKKGKGRHRK